MSAADGLRVLKYGDWDKARAILGKGTRPIFSAAGKAWEQEAKFLKRRLQEGIKAQAPGGKSFKPLAPTTLAVRKFLGFNGNKALMVTREFLQAIAVKKLGRRGTATFQVFVGILNGSKGGKRLIPGPSNRDLYKIALLEEFGSNPIMIQVTDRMRRFFFAAMRSKMRRRWLAKRDFLAGKSSGVIIVRIPPRPVFQPTWAKWGPGSRGRVQMVMDKELRGEYSR
jgi:hypothetical protein